MQVLIYMCMCVYTDHLYISDAVHVHILKCRVLGARSAQLRVSGCAPLSLRSSCRPPPLLHPPWGGPCV